MSWRKKIIFFGCPALIILLMFFLFHNNTISGKILYVNKDLNDYMVKVQADGGKIFNLYLGDSGLLGWFNDEPKKIIEIEGKITRDVSMQQFLDDIMTNGENVPEEGIPVSISYDPNIIRNFWFIHRSDGEIDKIKYDPPEKVPTNGLNIKEISRDNNRHSITYFYSYYGNPPAYWYVVNSKNGEVRSYTQEGNKFIENNNYYSISDPEVKFIEEFNQPNILMLNFKENPSGKFTVEFRKKHEMIENSYKIIDNLHNHLERDSEDAQS